MDSADVRHNASRQRFETGAGATLSVLDYAIRDDAIVFTHTFVPDSLRGHGIAGKLVGAGVAFAKSHQLRIIPQCSYVSAWLARHPG
jgi:predicted GNAT family acetyltransferase